MPVPRVDQRDLATRFVVVACLGGALSTLDTTVNIAFPAILARFRLDVPSLQWVVVTYVLTYAALLLPFGRLADRVGHVRVARAGLAISTIGLLACGLAPSFALFLVSRVVQGVGIALVLASAPALVTLAAKPERQARAVAIFQLCVAAGMAIGPPLGGVLLEIGTWRLVYLVRVPMAFVLLLLASPRQSPSSTSQAAVGETSTRLLDGLDAPGAVTFVCGLAALLLAASQGSNWGWASPSVLALVAGSFVLLGLFIAVEQRASEPLMQLSLFRNAAFSVANAVNALANAAMFTIWLLGPTLLVTHRKHGTIVGGLVLAAAPFAAALVAPVAGRWTARRGPAWGSTVGLAIAAVGLVATSQISVRSSTAVVVLSFALIGVGLGLFQVPNMSYVMGSISREQQGVAGGVAQLMRTAGVVIGVAAANALFVARSRVHARALGVATTDAAAFVDAFHDVLLWAAVLCALCALLSLVRPRVGSAPPDGAPARGLEPVLSRSTIRTSDPVAPR